jgi:hypothetical protein
VGLYAVVANGGYNAEFVCVEMSVGYLVIFSVKAKTKSSRVVQELNSLCISVDIDFVVIQAAPERQKQNPV